MQMRNILPPRDQIKPVEAGECISTEAASGLNEALADYRETLNPLFLFEAAHLCNANQIPLPEAVQQFINRIVSAIHCLSETGGGRSDIADIILGTRNDSGGYNAFELKEERRALKKLCRLVDDRLYQDEWVEGDKDHTETKVFGEVATELGLSPDHVRKKYKEVNPAHDSMGAKALQKAYRLAVKERRDVSLDEFDKHFRVGPP
jgi:hypothetical protein